MKKHGILIDGEGVVDGGETKILLQIFSRTVIGPIFFEFIQRKGDEGFGEGNFRALVRKHRGRPDPARRARSQGRLRRKNQRLFEPAVDCSSFVLPDHLSPKSGSTKSKWTVMG